MKMEPLRVRIKNGFEIPVGGETAKVDLFHLAKDVLGYNNMGPEHEQWANDLYENVTIKGIRKLVLLKPRGTYKTTFYTITLPIWLHLGDPTLTILIANAVGENSKKFLSEITGHYLRNPRLAHIYREFGYEGCPVDPNSTLATSLRLTNCDKIQKEPNITTTGYGSSIVSQHFDVIIVDDLVDRSDRESVAAREGKKKWSRDLASLLNPGGLLLYVGTRWHTDDTYNHIINVLNPQHKPKDRYHVEVEGAYLDDACTIARFPRILGVDKLEELKIDKSHPEFVANYMNNPLPAETQIFKLGEMGFFNKVAYDTTMKGHRLYGFCDPALGKKTGDYTTFITVGLAPNGTIYVLDAIIDRLVPDKAQELIIQQGANRRYVRIAIESNGFQEIFFDNIRKEAIEKGLYLPLEAVNNTKNKQGRIEAIQPLTFNSREHSSIIKFRDDWIAAYPKLMDQLIRFPLKSEHDDAPDALAGAIEMIRSPKTKEARKPFIIGLGR